MLQNTQFNAVIINYITNFRTFLFKTIKSVTLLVTMCMIDIAVLANGILNT